MPPTPYLATALKLAENIPAINQGTGFGDDTILFWNSDQGVYVQARGNGPRRPYLWTRDIENKEPSSIQRLALYIAQITAEIAFNASK
jgi:hypothetical protein